MLPLGTDRFLHTLNQGCLVHSPPLLPCTYSLLTDDSLSCLLCITFPYTPSLGIERLQPPMVPLGTDRFLHSLNQGCFVPSPSSLPLITGTNSLPTYVTLPCLLSFTFPYTPSLGTELHEPPMVPLGTDRFLHILNQGCFVIAAI